jgi:hypothetical protein
MEGRKENRCHFIIPEGSFASCALSASSATIWTLDKEKDSPATEEPDELDVVKAMYGWRGIDEIPKSESGYHFFVSLAERDSRRGSRVRIQ